MDVSYNPISSGVKYLFLEQPKITACLIVIFTIYTASFLILTFFYLFVFLRFAASSPNHQITESANPPPVSVIICARNEIDNLKKFLRSTLEQDYPQFEVIVVNDGSTDGSPEWLKSIGDTHLRIVDLEKDRDDFSGKRKALHAGINAAKHELVLLTDADCKPVSNHWISLMAGAVQSETQIVLGYSPCSKNSGFLNLFIRFENFLTGLYYLSFARAGLPYMGVGRNLLYRKSVRGQIGALDTHKRLMSGDDDLIVNRVANNRNIALMTHHDSQVYTLAPATLSEFIHQKRRHYSTGFYYKTHHKLALGSLYASQAVFNFVFLFLLLKQEFIIPAIFIFLVKNILQLLIYGKAMRKLNVQNLWIFTPVLDICASFFFVTLGSLSLFKVKTWK